MQTLTQTWLELAKYRPPSVKEFSPLNEARRLETLAGICRQVAEGVAAMAAQVQEPTDYERERQANLSRLIYAHAPERDQERRAQKRAEAVAAALEADMPHADRILRVVCAYCEVSLKSVLGEDRCTTIAKARGLACQLIREATKMSYPEIGVVLSHRNHSTIITACRRAKSVYGAELAELREALAISNSSHANPLHSPAPSRASVRPMGISGQTAQARPSSPTTTTTDARCG